MESRRIDPPHVYQQWCLLLEKQLQGENTPRELEALEWIEAEVARYEGQEYPLFRHQCRYILKHFHRNSFRTRVEGMFNLLHKQLCHWAEAQFQEEYRYEMKLKDSYYPPTWTIWDRQRGEIASVRGHELSNMRTHKQARRWTTGLNGLLYCSECHECTPHALLAGNEVQCQICLAQHQINERELY